MLRFSIKTLMFLTTIVAAWALVLRDAFNGPTYAAIAGCVICFVLIIWHIYRAECDQQANNEQRNGAGEGDETKSHHIDYQRQKGCRDINCLPALDYQP
jgi:hypothetical protein